MVTDQISFCKNVEDAFQKKSLSSLRKSLAEKLKELTSTSVQNDNVMQHKVQSLILDVIHNMEVVDQLQQENATSPTDWMWIKQLRFYSPGKKEPLGADMVRMGEGSFRYTFEYQGNAPKLVYTPLTDKCYLTLTQVGSTGMLFSLLAAKHLKVTMTECLGRPWLLVTEGIRMVQPAQGKQRASKLWGRLWLAKCLCSIVTKSSISRAWEEFSRAW